MEKGRSRPVPWGAGAAPSGQPRPNHAPACRPTPARTPDPGAQEDLVKRPFQPNTRKRAKRHGFRHRMATKAGRAVLKARRDKGRQKLSA